MPDENRKSKNYGSKTTKERIVDHPFWDDYVKILKSSAMKKEAISDNIEKLRQIFCGLMTSTKQLKSHWHGWQLGIPRPSKWIPEESLNLWYEVDIPLFLIDFFKRVEKGELYCDRLEVVDQFGNDLVKKRMGNEIGLHVNLEAVYWSFNIKFNKWIGHNIEVYDCSLVCDLDEILARADSHLRTAFFPTPSQLDIGPKKREEFQRQMLKEFAPDLENELMQHFLG